MNQGETIVQEVNGASYSDNWVLREKTPIDYPKCARPEMVQSILALSNKNSL